MTCEEKISTLNDAKAAAWTLFQASEIGIGEYKTIVNEAETTAGVAPTKWPC